MKKFLLIIMVLFTFGIVESQAQLLTKFKAKAGYNVALEYMKSTKGMQQPKLQFSGTFNQSIPLGEIPIEIEVDLNAGTATGWAYFFVDADNKENTGRVFLLKPIIGEFLTLEIPDIDLTEMGLEFGENVYISDFNWMDSDAMVGKLKANSDYMEFFNNYSPFSQIFVIVFAGENPDNNNAVEPLWAVSLSNENYVRNCAVQAETGLVFCTPIISSIIETITENLEVFPNPASDYLIINHTESVNSNDVGYVYDMFGRKVLEFNLHQGENSLSIAGLATGVYSIRINNKINKFIKQ